MRRPRVPLILATVVAVVALIPLSAPSAFGAVSSATTRFVAGFEGFYSCVYTDPAGHATIGYGHLIHLGAPTKQDRKKWGCLTKAEALKLLRTDLGAVDRQVRAKIRGARVNGPIITALTSFAFNLGAGALDRQKHRGSGKYTAIAANIRGGFYRKAGKQMLLYNGAYIGGRRVVLPGLVTRRKKEYQLIIKGANQIKRQCGNKCGSSKTPAKRGNGNGGMAAN